MKLKLSALILFMMCMLTVGVYAMEITTDYDTGIVTVSGDFDTLRSQDVSVSVFDTKGSLIPLYANQTVTDKGKYFHEFPLVAPEGTYKLVVSTLKTSQSAEFEFTRDESAGSIPADSNGVLQYEENFENTLDLWSTTGDVHITNGALVTNYGGGFKRAWMNLAPEYLWDNMIMNFTFTKGDTFDADNWIGADICRQSDGTRNLIFWRADKVQLTRADGTSRVIGYYNFEQNQPYEMKIVATGEHIWVYAKKADETQYTFIGSAEAENTTGTIGLSSWNTHTFFDNLKIYNCNTDVVVSEKPILLNVGKTKKIGLYKSYDNVSYASDKSSVVSVSNDGIITAIKAGTANITVTADGITEVVPVCVSHSLTGIALSEEQLDLYVGDAISVDVNLYPSSLTDARLVWKSSDENAVTLFGSADTSKTVVAKGVGTSVITVSNPSGSIVDTITVNVTEKEIKGSLGSLFEVSESARKIPATIYGVHYPLAGYVNIYKNFYKAEDAKLFENIGLNLIRGPEGGPANTYRWRTGDLSTRPLASGYPGFFIEDAYKIPEEIGVPYSYAVNVYEQSVEDIVEQINEIKKNTTQPIYLEMGNEVYDTFGNGVFPKITDYVNKCREIYKAVKEVDSSIKIGIVITVEWLADRLSWSPYISNWNDVIAENPDCYDAVIPHYYASMDDMSGFTQDEMAQALAAYNAELYEEMLIHAEMFPGKEIWATEYGVLYSDFHKQTRVSEMDRYQLYKTPGTATYNMELLLNMIKSGNVTLSAFHVGIGDSGLSVVQRNDAEDGHDYLPMYYTFTKVGELVNNYGYYYDIEALFTDKKTVDANHIVPEKTQEISYGGAWGFGTADGVKKAVIFNRSSQPMRVALNGYEISREWSYGGENHFGNYLQSEEYFNDFPNVELPWIGSAEYADYVILQPYTMAVFNIRKPEQKRDVCVVNAAYTLNDKVLNKLEKGNINAEYKVSNTSSQNKEAIAVLAVYKTENGLTSLHEVYQTEAVFKANSLTTVNIEFDIPASEGYRIKTIFIDSFDKIKPYCMAEIINQGD